MAISVNKSDHIFSLNSKGCTYAFGISQLGIPEHIYFGSQTEKSFALGGYSEEGKCHPIRRKPGPGRGYDLSTQPQELHTPYGGDFYEPSLVVEYANGNRRSDLKYTGYEIFEKKPALPGLPAIRRGQTLAVYLEDKGVKVTLFYTVSDVAPVIVRSMAVENLSDNPVRLDRAFSFAFSLESRPWRANFPAGHGTAETHWQTASLDRGIFTLDSKRGVSSGVVNPSLAIGLPDTDENRGTAYGVNLIYSGNWQLTAERIPTGIVRLCGGINSFDFSWLLEPGQRFQTPEAVLAYSDAGYSGLSRAYHDLYRENLIPERFAKSPRPVVINHWEDTEFAFDGQQLRNIISKMEGTGVDTFVLDDGWFHKRNGDSSGLGDWTVNEEKLGGSLKDLIDFTHKKGMRFGIWIEPEMINRDSDLFRAHPDWALQTPDEEPVEGRHQLVLDLTRQEVRDYIADTLNAIFRAHEIDYVKWDCNRDITEGYSLALPPARQKEMMHRQVLGVYDLCRRMVEGNPDILFEGCASGGSRYDPGMLYYFPQVWVSDMTDAPARTRIQYGASLCYPLSTMSCHVTTSPNRRANYYVTMQARGDIAHLGATGYELDTAKLSDAEFSQIRGQVEAYRRDEALVLEGDLYRLCAPIKDSNLFAVMLVAKDKCRAKLTAMRYYERLGEATRLYPKGLAKDAVYGVPELGKTMSGDRWMAEGILPTFPEGDNQTLTYHFETI